MEFLIVTNEVKLNGFRTALKSNKTRLFKVSFHKGTLTIHNKDLHNFYILLI